MHSRKIGKTAKGSGVREGEKKLKEKYNISHMLTNFIRQSTYKTNEIQMVSRNESTTQIKWKMTETKRKKKTKKNSERELYKREKQINLNQLSAS